MLLRKPHSFHKILRKPLKFESPRSVNAIEGLQRKPPQDTPKANNRISQIFLWNWETKPVGLNSVWKLTPEKVEHWIVK
jgi:hypothetical protein